MLTSRTDPHRPTDACSEVHSSRRVLVTTSGLFILENAQVHFRMNLQFDNLFGATKGSFGISIQELRYGRFYPKEGNLEKKNLGSRPKFKTLRLPN